MNIIRPHGLVERLDQHHRKIGSLRRYGRGKDGSPQNETTLRIARDRDRRDRNRQNDEALHGRLVDLDA